MLSGESPRGFSSAGGMMLRNTCVVGRASMGIRRRDGMEHNIIFFPLYILEWRHDQNIDPRPSCYELYGRFEGTEKHFSAGTVKGTRNTAR